MKIEELIMDREKLTDNDVPIEKKEIRGLTLRTLIWILASTVSIIVSIEGVYFALKSQNEQLKEQINEIIIDNQSNRKYDDLRLNQVENEVKEMKLEIQDIYNRLDRK